MREDFSALGFGKGAVSYFHVEEKFSDAVATVKEEILVEKTPVDFVAAVQEHFTKVGLDTAHEAIRVLTCFVLSNRFGDLDGSGSGDDGWILSRLNGLDKNLASVELLVGSGGHC